MPRSTATRAAPTTTARRVRLRTTTRTTANGTRVVSTTIQQAPELEWRLQAAGVRALRAMPGFGEHWASGVRFTLAADFNAARRSPQEVVKAKATGLTPGEHDVRIYLEGGRLGLIEVKGARGRLSPAQRIRHPLLAGLGFTLQAVVQVDSEDGAAAEFVRVVSGWLVANDR